MLEEKRSTKRVARIVAIDDDPLVLRMLTRTFLEPNYHVVTAEGGQAGIESVRRHHPDVVILDNVLPDLSGLAVLQTLRQLDPYLPVLFITAQGTSHTAIEAMKMGAFDFLPKPFELGHLEKQVNQALESRRLMRVPVEVNSGVQQTDPHCDVLIGRSHPMQEVYKAIGRVTSEDVPLLVQGEPGTGKELVARAAYQHGRRSQGPFFVVNCTDFSVEWLESELFGHAEAAFAGALSPRAGRLELCEGGVLVLEEIGDTSPATQSKLLRFLREGRFERLGGRETLTGNVSLICTTSVDLEQLVAAGRFRAELYYLLSSFKIQLPPLRERAEDIPLLVDYFVRRYSGISRSLTNEVTRVSPEALQLLVNHVWPGNIDELQSVLRRALHESKGTVLVSEFLLSALVPSMRATIESAEGTNSHCTDWKRFTETHVGAGSESIYADALTEMEKQLLTLVLDTTKGNQARAAKMLGITRGNLRKKIRVLKLNVPSSSRNGALGSEVGHDPPEDDDAPLAPVGLNATSQADMDE